MVSDSSEYYKERLSGILTLMCILFIFIILLIKPGTLLQSIEN